MGDFFSNEVGQTIEWFGLTHILLILGFVISIVLAWIFFPKLKDSKYEIVARLILLFFIVLFEWRVFESRMLENSIFRMPLCAVALYGLTFAVMFKKEKVFNIVYFYAFGSLLTYLFFDTPYGLDRWSGWTFFGAHATIAWLAVYGYRVFGYTPTKKSLLNSYLFVLAYGFIQLYAIYRFGGVDPMFLTVPAAEFLDFLMKIHEVVYLIVYAGLALLLMVLMYLPIYLTEKKKSRMALNIKNNV